MHLIAILIASFIASFGFGILFNIKGNKLILASIGGSLGGFVYTLALEMNCTSIMAMFFASISFSLYSEICARVCKSPVTTFIICALIPLVPGGGMYRTMLQAIQGDVNQAIHTGLNTLSIAGILALGILLVSTLVRGLYKARPVLAQEEDEYE